MEKKKRPEIVSSLPFSIRCREEIRVKRHWISRWIVRVGVAAPPDQGDDIWRVNACCAQYSFFFSLSLFFKAARFNEERGEKGGEFIRGAACSSLCQQRQRELISFSLAEKAAQRRSKRKREPRGTNELREIHREIMQIFQSFFPLPSTSIVPRQGLSRVFFPPSPDKFALIRGMRIFLTRVSFFLFLIIFEEYIETWIFLYFQDMWRYI